MSIEVLSQEEVYVSVYNRYTDIIVVLLVLVLLCMIHDYISVKYIQYSRYSI